MQCKKGTMETIQEETTLKICTKISKEIGKAQEKKAGKTRQKVG